MCTTFVDDTISEDHPDHEIKTTELCIFVDVLIYCAFLIVYINFETTGK